MQILTIKNPSGDVVFTVHVEPESAPPVNFANVPDHDPFIPGAPYTNGTVLMVSQGPPPAPGQP